VVYLYLVNYGKSRPEEIMAAINGFLSVSRISLSSGHRLTSRTAKIVIPLFED
jgi:hypothetical protein